MIEVDGEEITIDRPIDVLCKEEKIEIAFGRTLVQSPAMLIGKSVTLRLSNVPDLALNVAQSVEWTFTVGEFSTSAASVSLTDVRVPLDLLNGSGDISVQVAAALIGDDGAPLTQIKVTQTGSGGSDPAAMRKRQVGETVTVTVEIEAEDRDDNNKNALQLAANILSNDEIDTNNANVALSTNEMAPMSVGVGTPREPPGGESSPTEDALAFFQTTIGIIVICVIACLVLCVCLLVVVMIMRTRGGKNDTNSAEMKPTVKSEQTIDFNKPVSRRTMSGRQLSRRASSRRRAEQHSYKPFEGATTMETGHAGQYPPAPQFDTQSTGGAYGVAPPERPPRLSATTRQSSRRSRRGLSRRSQAAAAAAHPPPIVMSSAPPMTMGSTQSPTYNY